MSAIWGIVDLSVAQSEAQRKNRAGNLWEEVLRMRQAYRTSCLDRIQEKGRQPIIWPAGYRMSQGKLWKKDSLMKERESAEVCSWRM